MGRRGGIRFDALARFADGIRDEEERVGAGDWNGGEELAILDSAFPR